MSEEKSGNEEVLYVIGNGFDLNLGLKTRYQDFFEYINGDKLRTACDIILDTSIDESKKLLKKMYKFANVISKERFEVFLDEKYIDNHEDIGHDKKTIFTCLEFENNDLLINKLGLFFIFMMITKPEKNWNSIEKQISKFIEDLVNIFESNYEQILKEIFSNPNQIIKMIKNGELNELKKYKHIYKLIELLGNLNEKNTWQDVINKVEIINFSLDNIFKTPGNKKYKSISNLSEIEFDIQDSKEKITKKINLLDNIRYLEKKFLEYANKENDKALLELNGGQNSISGIKDKIDKIITVTKFDIINFNYTTYLKDYLKNKSKSNRMININGSVDSKYVIFGIDKIEGEKIISKYKCKKQNVMRKVLEKFYKPSRRTNKENEWEKLEYKNYNKIYFYGHSLEDSDFDFFKNLFDDIGMQNLDNKIEVQLIFLYESDYYDDGKVQDIVKLFHNYYKKLNSTSTVSNIIKLKESNILKIKMRIKKRKNDIFEEDRLSKLILDNEKELQGIIDDFDRKYWT